jgi:hypothetical protein
MADRAPEDDHVQVAETGHAYEAELIALRLRASGIEAHVVDQTFHAEPMPDVRSLAVVRVMVPAAQAEAARRVLASATPLPEDVEPEGGPPEVM